MSEESPSPAAAQPGRTFFLVGATRSGTTLLGLMLGHHPDVAFPGEFEWAVDFMRGESGRPPVAEYVAWLEMNRHFRHHRPRVDASLSYDALVRSFLAQLKEQEGGADRRWVGVAVHRHFDRLLAVWPEAHYLHLVRDPRDVTRSWLERGWCGNAWSAAREWCALEALWDSVAKRLPPERVLELRYEALVADPAGTLGRICERLGVPYSERMLSYHERTSYGPVDARQVGKWRSALPPREVQLFEGVAADALARRGYALSGLPPLRPGAAGRALLALEDRYARWHVRLRQFGLSLWLQDRLARLLRLEGWRRRIELRRQAVINEMLQ